MTVDPNEIEDAQSANDRLQHRLPVWQIFNDQTMDFPGRWVARMFLAIPEGEATDHIIVGDSHDEIREALPPGLVCIAKSDEDADAFIETWM